MLPVSLSMKERGTLPLYHVTHILLYQDVHKTIHLAVQDALQSVTFTGCFRRQLAQPCLLISDGTNQFSHCGGGIPGISHRPQNDADELSAGGLWVTASCELETSWRSLK